jgi:hypothetical protein
VPPFYMLLRFIIKIAVYKNEPEAEKPLPCSPVGQRLRGPPPADL